MSDLTVPGRLIWTVLPRGRTGATLRLSVLLSPRLAPDGGGTTSTTGDFVDWPAVARSLRFSIVFDDGASIVATVNGVAVDAAVPDSATWTALMTPLGVSAHRGAAKPPAAVVSYGARETYANVVAGYRPDPSEVPPAGLSTGLFAGAAPRDAARRKVLGLVAPTSEARARVRAEATRLTMRRGAAANRPAARRSAVPAAQIVFDQAAAYFDRLNAGARTRASAPPPTPARFDIHDAVTVYARYPWLLRRLGLVFDLEFALPPDVPSSGRVRALPSGGAVAWQHTSPWSCFELAADRFDARANPATSSTPLGIDGGLFLPHVDDAALTMDLDPLIHGVRATALRFQADVSVVVPTLPAPRSAGLAFARRGMGDIVSRMLDRQAQLEQGLADSADGSALQFFAEDLMRGFRVDIRETGSTTWRSLHRRRGSYRLADGAPLASVDDEGFATLHAFNPEAEGSAVWTHDLLFRWLGWSLSAPRPGRTIGRDGGLIDNSGDDATTLPLRVHFDVQPGSLPRLRFGVQYESRLRVVDLAGNSIAPDSAVEEPPLTLGGYYRFDPLLAPALRVRDAAQPCEYVDAVVLRSPLDMHAAGNAERWVAPPRSTVQMAEWHGMLDTASGVDPSAYTTIASRDGTFADAPYGSTVPALPYLPDPLARGAWWVDDVEASPVGAPAPATIIPFGGRWPALEGFRIRLIEGSGGPNWDAAQRVLTIALPKGRRASWRLTTALDVGRFDPLDPSSAADLALFDSWQSVWSATHAPSFRLWHWQHVASGRDDQLTPYRRVSFVHAVPRPLIVPALDGARLSPTRRFFGTGVVFGALTPLDVPSTGQVDLLGEWDDAVDDGVHPPSRQSTSAHLGRVTLEYPASSPTGDALVDFAHELGDTRHHRMTCWMVATTRYREHFPDLNDPAQLTQTSARVTIDVPASAPPVRPKVVAVLPVYAFDPPGSGATPSPRRRTGLRVVLDRPWYSSGDDERLGIVLPIKPIRDPQFDTGPGPGPRPTASVGDGGDGDVVLVDESPPYVPDSLVPLVSQWGIDPLMPGGPLATPFAPLPRHFTNVRDKAYLFSVENVLGAGELFVWDRVLVSFDVQFVPPDPSDPTRPADATRDSNDGYWICDLELASRGDAGVPYMPFVRLALARFQPFAPEATTVLSPSSQMPEDHHDYGGDMRVSEIVLADFVQLAPERSASIVTDPADSTRITVTVTGPGYAANDHAQDEHARPAAVLVVDAQADIGEPGTSLWVTLASAEASAIAMATQGGIVQWSVSLALPFARGSRAQRLVLRENECLPSDVGGGASITSMTIVRRLVYSDILTL